MSAELFEDRVLGAVLFVDGPLALPIARPLGVAAAGIAFRRNRSGLHVIVACTGLERYVESFENQPTTRAVGSVRRAASVRDPSGQYLARAFEIRLPRDASPAAPADADLFKPQIVPLYPGPAARTESNWALVRASVTRGARHRPAAGALLQVRRTGDDALLGTGLTDERGEALLAVPGVPVTTWSEDPGAVIASEIEVRVDTVFDAALRGLPNPEELAVRADGVVRDSRNLRLASGRTEVLTVGLP